MNNGVLFGNILSLFEKKKHGKSLEDFVYIVWNSSNLGYFVGKILEFQYHKIETKNCCS
jgi:hypothetical protein